MRRGEMSFSVEGRYFPNSLYAFTFAQIQADRMKRPVEVHTYIRGQDFRPPVTGRRSSTYHATAQPSHFVRRHLVKETCQSGEFCNVNQ